MLKKLDFASDWTVALLIGERDIADNRCQFPPMGSVDQIAVRLVARRAAGLVDIVPTGRRLNSLKESKEPLHQIACQVRPSRRCPSPGRRRIDRRAGARRRDRLMATVP
jgi:hypothetical protein